VFPRPAWEAFRAKLLALPMSAEDWRRIFIGSAMDVQIDSASRVLIAPELREWAGIERDVLLVGMGSASSCGTRSATTPMRRPCWRPACPMCCVTT